jgi:hypothetical protein
MTWDQLAEDKQLLIADAFNNSKESLAHISQRARQTRSSGAVIATIIC